MRCGELGHKAKEGNPCEVDVSSESRGRIWHNPESTPEQRSQAARNGPFLLLGPFRTGQPQM